MEKWIIVLLIIAIVFITFVILSLFSLDIIFSDLGEKLGTSLRYSPSSFSRIFF